MFTEDDLVKGAENEALGPEYFAANRVAAEVMAKFKEERFKPLIDEFADQFRDKLWDDVRDYLIGDTEMNVQSSIRQMAEGTIRALLTGEEWAMKRYPFCNYNDGEKIRKRIAEHVGDEIARHRIADLEKEVKRLTESLRHARGSY